MASRTPRILCVARLSRWPDPAPTKPKTSRRSWGLQKAKGRKGPAGGCRRSTCWSDTFRRECGPPTFALPEPDRASASSSCGPRFHPRKPNGAPARRPTVHASVLFFRPRRAGLVRRRPEFFLYLQPSRRSHRSTVEVRKGRSRRAPNSASVASGCSESSFSSRCLRSSVSSARRPLRRVRGSSVPRC